MTLVQGARLINVQVRADLQELHATMREKGCDSLVPATKVVPAPVVVPAPKTPRKS